MARHPSSRLQVFSLFCQIHVWFVVLCSMKTISNGRKNGSTNKLKAIVAALGKTFPVCESDLRLQQFSKSDVKGRTTITGSQAQLWETKMDSPGSWGIGGEDFRALKLQRQGFNLQNSTIRLTLQEVSGFRAVCQNTVG